MIIIKKILDLLHGAFDFRDIIVCEEKNHFEYSRFYRKLKKSLTNINDFFSQTVVEDEISMIFMRS